MPLGVSLAVGEDLIGALTGGGECGIGPVVVLEDAREGGPDGLWCARC